MRRLVVLGCIVACTDTPKPPAVSFDVDVAVSDDHVMLFTGGGDLDCACTGLPTFPTPDRCTELSDAVGCKCDPPAKATSCIASVTAERAGATIAQGIAGRGTFYVAIDATVADLALVIDGCDHEPSRIPISGGPLPRPTITTAADNGLASVRWTTDVPSDAALVTITNGTWGAQCHVVGTNHITFELPASATRFASVQPFIAPAMHAVPLGTARVWRGSIGDVLFVP